MSELIYASEVQTPPEIDWTNPDTDGLLTCQFDDGTTVTNCITGATGEVFDVSNIVGIADGSKRVSATWTSKPALIDSNPFSLLQTIQDVQQEHGLKLTTASESISIPFTGAYTGTLTYTDGTTLALSGSGTYTLDGTTPSHISKIQVTDTVEYHYFSFNQTNGSTVQSLTSSLVATLNNFPADSGYIRDASTGLISGYQFNGVDTYATLTTPLKLHCDSTLSSWEYEIEGILYSSNTSVKILGNSSSYANYLILSSTDITVRFGATSNTRQIITCTIPFDDLKHNIKIQLDSGVFTILLDDNVIVSNVALVKTPENGTVDSFCRAVSQYSRVGLVFVKFKSSPNGTTLHNWDFTTGDTDTIQDTISGNNATINNAKTSGFMPVIPKQVYQIKADGTMDYTGLDSIWSAHKYDQYQLELLLYSDQNLLSRLMNNNTTTFPYGINIKGMGNKFIGDFNDTGVIKLTADPSIISYFIYDQSKRLTFTNLNIITDNRTLIYNLGGGGFTLDNCGVTSNGIEALNVRGGSGLIHVKDSVIRRLDTGYVQNLESLTTNPILENSVFIGRFDNNLYPMLRVRYSNVSYTNCIGINQGTGTKVFGVVFDELPLLGSNNISSDTTATTLGIGTQDTNLLTYFTDPTNGDYTINTTGQTVLAGQGWNGSDIAGWAYATSIPVSGMDIVAQDISVATNIAGVALTKIANIIANILSTATNIETNPITKTSNLNATSINVANEIASSIITSIKNLTAFGISTSTTINNIVLLTVNSLIAKNIIVGTKLLTGSLNRAASVNTSSINVGTNSSTANTTKVSNILAQSIVTAIEETLGTLHKTTNISTKDISTGTNIKLASLLRAGNIVTSNIDVLTQTSNVSLTRYGTVIPNSINISTSINGNSISKNANILINEMNIPTNISNINLYTGVIKPIDPTLLTISDSNVSYIISSEITYKVN